MLVAPNNAKSPGVSTKYKLIGKDHKNAINMRKFLEVREAAIAKQAGRNNIKNVLTIDSNSDEFE